MKSESLKQILVFLTRILEKNDFIFNTNFRKK